MYLFTELQKIAFPPADECWQNWSLNSAGKAAAVTSASWQQRVSAVRKNPLLGGSWGLVGAVLLVLLALMALGSIPSWPHHLHASGTSGTLQKPSPKCAQAWDQCSVPPCPAFAALARGRVLPVLGTEGVGAQAVGTVHVSSPALQANCTGVKSLRAVNCTESPAATPLPPQNQLPCLQPGPSGP